MGLRVCDPMRSKGCIFADLKFIVDHEIKCDRMGVVYKIVCNTYSLTVETDSTDNWMSDSDTHNHIGIIRTSLHDRMLAYMMGQSR